MNTGEIFFRESCLGRKEDGEGQRQAEQVLRQGDDEDYLLLLFSKKDEDNPQQE